MNRKQAIGILLITAVLVVLAGWRTLKIGFNYDFEAFFPHNDPETLFFQDFRKKFGPDNDFILIGVKSSSTVFSPDFIRQVKALADSLRALPLVEQVINPVDMVEIIRDPLLGTPIVMNYFRPDSVHYRSIDSVRVFKAPELLYQFVSEDATSMSLLLHHTPYIGDADCQPLTDKVRQTVANFQFPEYHVAGRCIGQSYYVDVIKTELVVFLALAFILIIGILIFIYRSFWGVVIPLVTVGISVLFSTAFMQVTGKEMDVLANVIPTILVVVGLSVAIHIQTKFLDLLPQTKNASEALKKTLQQVGWPAFFTTLTTFVGFISLTTTGIIPIDDFGLYSAIGICIGFVVAMISLPAMLLLAPIQPKPSTPGEGWNRWMNAIYRIVLRRTKLILWISGIFTAVSILGASLIRENTFLLEDLRDGNPLKEDFRFFATHFSGTRPYELALEVPDTNFNLLDVNVLRAQEKLGYLVDSIYGISFSFSPLTLVKTASRTMAGGDSSSYALPASDSKLKRILREIQRYAPDSILRTMMTPDRRWGRFRAMIPDVGSARAWEMRTQLMSAIDQEIPSQLLRVHPTGTAELIDKNNRNLALNIGVGLVIAFVVIIAIIGLQFKSWKMVLISIIPNFLPMLFLAAIMGFSGISLKISTAILFTIAFGIAVDDTIHFLGKLRLVLKQTDDMLYALRSTLASTGKAIVFTSLILCAGFLILGLSDFQATRLIGLLISSVLLFALICDLFLLPALLLVFFKKRIPHKGHVNKS